jgi:lysophospholipase L1-like esterase
MKQWLRRLGVLLAAVLLIAAGLVWFGATRFPRASGLLALNTFRDLPPSLRENPQTWHAFRGWMRMLQPDETPAEVAKAKRGEFRRAGYLVVALGDSTTAGTGLRAPESWPYKLEEKMRWDLPDTVRVINAGIPGESAPGGLDRLERDVLDLKPDLATIGYLINDGRIFYLGADGGPRVMVEDEEFLAVFEKMFAALAEAGIPTLLFTCQPLYEPLFAFHAQSWPEQQEQIFARRVAGLKQLAARHGVHVVDSFTAVATHPEVETLYLTDGIHLGAAGHQLMSELIYAKWKEAILPPPAP